jgi:hypothetical protein
MRNDFQKTGNCTADMVASCVSHYRYFNKPLKAIYLKERNFEEFKQFVISKTDDIQQRQSIYENQVQLEFDKVNIMLGSKFSEDPMYVEFYDTDGGLKKVN